MEVCFVVVVMVFLLASDRGSMVRLLSRRSYEAAWALRFPCWCFHLTQLTLKANVTVSSLPFRSILCHGCGCVRASDTVKKKKSLFCAARQRHPIPFCDSVIGCQHLSLSITSCWCATFSSGSPTVCPQLLCVACLRGDVMFVAFLFAHCGCNQSCAAYSEFRALNCMNPMTTYLLP